MWNHSLEQVNDLLCQSPCLQEDITTFLVVVIALACTHCEEYMANGESGQVHYWVQGKCMVTSMRRHERWNFGFAAVRTPMTWSRDSSNGTWWLQNSTFFWGFQGLWGMLDVELIPEEWKLPYKCDMKTSLLKDSHVVHCSNFNGVVN
jgi:hypothetical protein